MDEPSLGANKKLPKPRRNLKGCTIRRVKTGVQGLDKILEGGIPSKSIILVCGGPGAGKTIMTLQYLVTLAERGEPIVYVSLEEPMMKKRENAVAFNWDIEKYEKDGLLRVLDLYTVPNPRGSASIIDRVSGRKLPSLGKAVVEAVETIDAKHVILDPITSILVHESRSSKKRLIISMLFDTIRDLSCTALITSETLPDENNFYLEHFLADGVFYLRSSIINYNLVKTICVEKMRGTMFDGQPRRYLITSKGLQVFPSEPVIV
jgi:KaiC/GvpD/RAD55 family RecA-like ATPase